MNNVLLQNEDIKVVVGKIFSEKEQTIHILGFAGHLVLIAAT